MYHLLGLDPKTELRNHQNRPIMIAEGNVVHDVVA